MSTAALILQNAHDIMGITEQQVFVPLNAIKQVHMRKLQGGASGERTQSRRYTANVEKIQKIVKQIQKLYAQLKEQLKKPFRTQGEESQAQRLVSALSTKLTNAVKFFVKNLRKIKKMPAAVARAMGQWWPFTQKAPVNEQPVPQPVPQRRSARTTRSPERFVPY